jgi:hypothetical protein
MFRRRDDGRFFSAVGRSFRQHEAREGMSDAGPHMHEYGTAFAEVVRPAL